MPVTRFLACSLAVPFLISGCGGGASREDPPEAGVPGVPGPPPNPPGMQGRYVGTVTIDGEQLQADAILTEDGIIRLAFGWPGPSSGVIPDTRPGDPAQFVGDFVEQGSSAAGAGNIYGEACADRDTGFCDGILSATFTLDDPVGSPGLLGELRVSFEGGIESWFIDLWPWENYYVLPATSDGLAGSYTEKLAEFVGDENAVITIDATGGIFFQSAVTGCVGNGQASPHLAGTWNVYDIELEVSNCVASYDYLNGGFEGLATTSPSDAWAYDHALRTWLTKPVSSPSPAAVTTWAPYNY